MADPVVRRPDDRRGNGEGKGSSGRSDDDMKSLRAMLLGPEQRSLAALQARFDDLELRAEDIGQVLPQVLMQRAQDPDLTRALTPPLEKAITASVQRNPKPLADALFPVMGPAIRKAVAAGIAGAVESLGRTLENSLSWRSLQWRLEAKRTGKSFAEIVLIKTLVYRVEQVFLIDRKTGLLLQHVKAEGDDVQDADMVSGMLTAIRSFVGDSFRVGEHDSLEALKVGDLSVWIEAGPHAIVAAVVRGMAPPGLRVAMQDALEAIHFGFGEVLESFNGDATALADTQPLLEACLQTEVRAEERQPRTRGALIAFGIVVVALLVWAGFSWRAHRRWNNYVDALRVQPGLVVVSEGKHGGKFVVSGLRDPLAPDPQAFVAASGLRADQIEGQWAPYQALDSSFVVARARSTLLPPDGVTLTLTRGVLSATGVAPLAWVTDMRRMAPLVAGVTRFDAVGALAGVIEPATAVLQGATFLFPKGRAQILDGQDSLVAQVVKAARTLDAAAGAAGVRYHIEIVGHADEDGAPELNVPLSRSRANTVMAAMTSVPLTHVDVVANGVGSADPAVASHTEEDKQKNRRVTLRVGRPGA